MADVVGAIGQRVEDFVRDAPQFKEACDSAFEMAASNAIFTPGRVSPIEALGLVRYIWERIEPALDDLGLSLDPPSDQEVSAAFAKTSRGSTTLDRQSFEDFFILLMKNMAGAVATDAAKTYGLGVIAGLAAVHITKRIVRAVPVAGTIAAPFLGLAPTLILGPAIGIAMVWGHTQGDIFAVRRFLIPGGARASSTHGPPADRDAQH